MLTAAKARMLCVEAVSTAASGHPGGSLSCIDALTELYFDEMNINPADPAWEDRDRFVLSRAIAPRRYIPCSHSGIFPHGGYKALPLYKAHYSGHPDMRHVPGVDMSTGSLGQGLSAAVRHGLAARLSARATAPMPSAAMVRSKRGRSGRPRCPRQSGSSITLCAFVDIERSADRRRDGGCHARRAADKKFEAFNWNVISVDGHDFSQLADALTKAKETKGKPTMILMHTVKGKGVSFYGKSGRWHGKAPERRAVRAGNERALKPALKNWRCSEMAGKIATRNAYGEGSR